MISQSLLLLLIIVTSEIFALRLRAQTFSTLYDFTAYNLSQPQTNSDGALPVGGLGISGSTLYGTTARGGEFGAGTIFRVNIDGTGFTNLHNFTASPNESGADMGLVFGVTLVGDKLYGTAAAGGASGNGTVFAINTDGTGFTNLYDFTNGTDGSQPQGALTVVGDTIYGAAGSIFGGLGALFALKTNGSQFKVLHTFAPQVFDPPIKYTNSEGAVPQGGFALSDGTLYGAALTGGSAGVGTLFKINIDGTGFTNLYTFKDGGPDGYFPLGGLVLSGQKIYGTTFYGGDSGKGTIFSIGVDGGGFVTLYSFPGAAGGETPYAGLILSGNTLYGTTASDAGDGNGTVFSAKLDGSDLQSLYDFTGGSDGYYPITGVIIASNTLYGTAYYGGSSLFGSVFSLALEQSSQPPSIDNEPVSQTVTAGGSVIFSVIASGSPPLSYQWQFDSTNLTDGNGVFGAGTSALTLTNVAPSQSGTYRVIITNSLGSVTSAPVSLVVNISAPLLTIARSGLNIILMWPADSSGFTLKSTSKLGPPPVWTVVSTPPVSVNGTNVVTNIISETLQFYQLVQ